MIYYLVKWCSLPYEDSTWELKEDVDEGKVREFKSIQARHPELKRVVSDISLPPYLSKKREASQTRIRPFFTSAHSLLLVVDLSCLGTELLHSMHNTSVGTVPQDVVERHPPTTLRGV